MWRKTAAWPIGALVLGFLVTLAIPKSSFAIGTRSANTTLSVPEVPESFGYQLENALPGLSFAEPVAVVSRPGEPNQLFVVEKRGVIYIVPDVSAPTKSVFLDISDEVIDTGNEVGLLSLEFHPNWGSNKYFYVMYTTLTTTSAGTGLHDRLSRFEIDPINHNQALIDTEQPFITQYDEAGNHNGGELKFGPDGYLYTSIGDEGDCCDAFDNSRFINKDFFSAILRIDVDKNPENLEPNSHYAIHLDSQDKAYYSVPSDNPFIGATSFQGDPIDPTTVRTEFWASGLRNPWRFSFDSATGEMYCADVGQYFFEELNIIEKGSDYGWPLREGLHGFQGSTVPSGTILTDPILEYNHIDGASIPGGLAEGKSIIGGVVYRGNQISQLNGYYLFADNGAHRLFALRYDSSSGVVENFQQLTTITSPTSFGLDPINGDVLIASLDGTIYRLVYSETPISGDPIPTMLSNTGAFSDLTSLTPETGIEPYDINVPFWSDHAIKSRWFSVPDLADTVGFDATENWSFPDGTVWIKHFEMEMVEGDPLSKRRLETRFLVKNTDGIHGFTYKWNAGETDAFLVDEEGEDEVLTILDSEDGVARTQTWHYPSRSECLQCHTSVGGYALGFNTRQLNGDYDYGAGALNQIGTLDTVGYFDSSPGDPGLLDELYSDSHPSATAEDKARSYLEANCIQCHQPGGPALGSWDARILTDLSSAGIVDGELVNNQGDPDNKVIAPGDLTHSMILQRMSTRGSLQMPPLGSNEIDSDGITLMSNWISSLGGGGASPVLSGSRSSFTFAEGDGETVIDNSIGILDTDTTDFSSGSLSISLVGSDGIDDRLSIQNQGSGSGQIGVSASTVSYEGTPIGTFSGGDSFTSPLEISISSSASTAVMTALSQAITFQNISPTPLLFDRTVELLITDETSLASNTLTYTISITSIPEDPIINWSNPSDIVYGTALSATQLNATASVAGTFAYSPDAGTVLGAGSSQLLQVTFTPADTQNYNVVVDSVDINVTKAIATLTATDASRLYGSSNPAFSFTASGLLNGDTIGDVDTPPSLSTTATISSSAGGYTISISGASDPNYDFTYGAGTLTVDPASLTIKANDKSRPYGQSNPVLTATYTGLVLGEGPSDLDADAILSTSAGPSSTPGSYSISSSGASDSNYSIIHAGGVLTVGKASVTLTASDAQRLYGSANPAFSFTASGLLNGDTIDDIDTPPTLSSTAIAASPVGNYPISISGAADDLYDFAYTTGTITVNPVPLSIKADDLSRPYGQSNPELTATYTGFVQSEGPEDLDSPLSLATTADASSPAGSYPITASGAADPNYTITVEGGTLSVEKAVVTLTAIDSQRTYGSSNPLFTFEASGFLNGDTIDDIDSLPSLSTTATPSNSPGDYSIEISGASDSGYDFLYTPGTLNVTPAPLVVAADNKERIYGELNPPFTAAYSGFVLGEGLSELDSIAGLSSNATSASPAGEYTITPSGASSPNYAISFQEGTLTVGRAEATLTASDAQRTYGSLNPDFPFTISGLVNGDISIADIDTHPTLTTLGTETSPPGTYSIEISGASDPNYNFSYEPGTLLIEPAPLTIKADDKEREFGQPNPELTETYSGFVLNQGPQDLDTPPVLQTTATVDSPSALYEITVSGASDPNYEISFQSGSLSIGRTIATLTANSFERPYGSSNPEFTYTVSGLMNGDTLADIDTLPTMSSTATQSSDVGSYNIEILGAEDTNYFFAYQAGNLEINPANLAVSTPNLNRSYGSSNPEIVIQYQGFVLEETAADLDTPPIALTSALLDSPVGEYSIELSGGDDNNYLFSYSPATLTVDPAPLIISADDKGRSYGELNPPLTATYSEFVLGEGPQNLSSPVVLSTTATVASPTGEYAINTSGASSPNYAITHQPGTLSVRRAVATLTATDVQRTYGSPNPGFSFSAAGLVNGESINDIDTQPTLSTSAVLESAPGNYVIDILGASDPNYDFGYSPGTLLVEPAKLTVQADNKSREFGEPNPTLTATYTGFVLSEGPVDLDTQAELSTDADPNSPNGLYDISVSGASDSNYEITFVDGFLSIGRTLAILKAENKQKIYGSPNPPLTYAAIDLVQPHTIADIDTPPTLSTIAIDDSDVGKYTISISGAEDSEYFFVYDNAELEILPTTLSISADDKSKLYGQPNPVLSATYSGFVSDDGESDLDTPPTISTEALRSSIVGDYAINISGASDLNYEFEYEPGTLTVEPAALTIIAEDKRRTYGQANPSFTASYVGLVLGDTPESIGTQIILSSSATLGSPPGDYPISASGSVNTNYQVEFIDGLLVINAFVGSLKLTYQHEDNTSTVLFSGVPLTKYLVEVSPDINSWQPVANTTTDENGSGEYTFEIDRNQFTTLFLRIVPQNSE